MRQGKAISASIPSPETGSRDRHTVGMGALMAASFVGLLASMPPESPFKLVVFFVSLAGLLAGGVLLSGSLLRRAAAGCGVRSARAARAINHFVGVGFSASAMYLLGLTAFFLSLITWDGDGVSEFSGSQRALSAIGWGAYSVFMWPGRVLMRLGWDALSGWAMWLISSLFYGAIVYVAVVVFPRLMRCTSGGRTQDQHAPNERRAT